MQENNSISKVQIILAILSVFIIAGGIVYNRMTEAPLHDKHDKIIQKYYSKKDEYVQATKQIDAARLKSKTSVNTVDQDRVKEDTKQASKYFAIPFNYKGTKEFNKARKDAISKYGANFTKNIMPKKITKDTNYRNLDDIGTVKLYPYKVSGDAYMYNAVIEYSVSEENQTEFGYAFVTFVSNKDKKFEDVESYFFKDRAVSAVM